MQMYLQIATATDLELLLKLKRQFQAFFQETYDQTKTPKAFQALLSNPVLGQIFLIQQDQQNIGYVVLTFGFSIEFGGRDAFIDEFFIDEVYRHQGFGNEVLKLLTEIGVEAKIKALHLEVDKTNFPAQKLYQKAGFEERNYFLMTKLL
jgi:diamine N-acetyltransferase